MYVDDNLCGTVNYEQGLGVYKIYCDTEGIAGRNVRILAAPRQYLTLCEVKVMSDPKKDGRFIASKLKLCILIIHI